MWPSTDRIRSIVSLRFDNLSEPGPALSVGHYADIHERAQRERRGMPPWEHPARLILAERFLVRETAFPACGDAHNDNGGPRRPVVHVPANWMHPLWGLVAHHERAHAWIRRQGLDHDATDVDAWLLTAWLIWPPALDGRHDLTIMFEPHVPRWFFYAVAPRPWDRKSG